MNAMPMRTKGADVFFEHFYNHAFKLLILLAEKEDEIHKTFAVCLCVCAFEATNCTFYN